MPTPNLNLTHLQQNTTNPEVVVNALADGLDIAMNDTVSIAVAGSPPDITITSTQFNENHFIILTGTTPGSFTATIPSNKRTFVIYNNTGSTATVSTPGSPAGTLTLIDGEIATVYHDGNDVLYKLATSSGTGAPYDIGLFFPDTPQDAENIAFVIPRPLTLPASAAGSQAYALTPPNAQYDIDVQKNGASIGTVRFAASVNAGTFVGFSATSFAVGDRLELITPSVGSPAENIADILVTFVTAR